MSTGRINIRPAELRAEAERIRSEQSNLENKIAQICAKMKSTASEGWMSSAGQRLREQFEQLRAFYMAQYPPAFEQYVTFLINTADEYEALEARKKQAVDGLQVRVG